MRKLILILALACVFAWMLPQTGMAEVDPETAVGVWLFDEGGGDTTADSSGHDHEGTINGAKWEDGKFGKALDFDGGDWVSIESTPELQAGEEFTLMAWFFATDIGDWRQLIAKNAEYLLRIDPPQEGNKMSAFVFIGGWEPRASANVPDEDTWIHYAATYDSNENNEQLVLYVNGERAGASTRPGNIAGTNNPVEIGRWGGGSYFVGIIDEAAIFNVALGEDDLKTIMEHGLSDTLGGLASVAPTNKLTTTWATLKADR